MVGSGEQREVSAEARAEDGPGPASLASGARAGSQERASAGSSPWLNYAQAAAYCGWCVGHLRNLVSAGQIPVYGKPRSRRFRRDMLDLYLTDPDAALRQFRSERDTHGG